MANRRRSEEVPVGEENDEPDPAEAVPDTDEEEEPAPPAPTTRHDENLAVWKKKYYDMSRQNSEMATEYRGKINQLQDEVRELKMKNWPAAEEPSASGGEARKPSGGESDDAPPYVLVKQSEAMAANGSKILVPRIISGVTFERIPRLEDVPEKILLQHGAGEYKIRDARGRITGSIVVGNAEGGTGAGVSVAPAIAGIGQYMLDPATRALQIYDEAVKRNDPKMAQMAALALQRAMEGGTAAPNQQDQLTNALATITALFGAMNQAQATFRATGFGGNAESEAVALKRLELELAEKKSKGLTELGTAMVREANNIVPQIAQLFKKPDIKPEEVAHAATRLSREATQTPKMPPATPRQMGTPPSPGAPPAARAPPPRQPSVPPGTKVQCGSCGQMFEVNEIATHLQTTQCGNGVPQPAPVTKSPSMPSEVKPVQIPPDFKYYLEQMKTLTTYIVAWSDGDDDASPERIAATIWLGTTGDSAKRDKLKKLAEEGYDNIVSAPELDNTINALARFPQFTDDETQAFLNVLLTAQIITPADVAQAKDLTDLTPAVDELMNHITIQKSAKGREWYCRLLNAIALKAGVPAPHAEFIPGAQPQAAAGRDNL